MQTSLCYFGTKCPEIRSLRCSSSPNKGKCLCWVPLAEVVGSATHISLARHKTAILGMALPLGCGGRSGQAASLSTPDRGRGVAMPHLRRWYGSLVLPWEKSQRTRRPAPRQSWGPPLFSCREDQPLSYTKDRKHPNGGVSYQTFFKYFLMFSNAFVFGVLFSKRERVDNHSSWLAVIGSASMRLAL